MVTPRYLWHLVLYGGIPHTSACDTHLHTQGMEVNRDVFPDTILNGRQLDLFNLYKEVVKRGGIRYVASHSADGNE